MTTELEARLCTNPDPDRRPLRALLELVDLLRSTGFGDLNFRGFRVFTEGELAPVFQQRDRLGSDDLLTALERWDSPTASLSTRTAIIRYKIDSGSDSMRESLVAAWIGSSGGRYPGRGGDWWVDGDARLSITSATPYIFPSSPAGDVLESADVRENVNILRKMLSAAIRSLKPVGLKVYTDAGEFFPFNAHFAYFAQSEEMLRDVSLMRRLWSVGHPVLQLPPLGEVEGDAADFLFHLWRNPDERHRLQRAFGASVGTRREVQKEDVMRVGTAGDFILDPIDSGFMVSSGRFPLNSFLDRFYLHILGEG